MPALMQLLAAQVNVVAAPKDVCATKGVPLGATAALTLNRRAKVGLWLQAARAVVERPSMSHKRVDVTQVALLQEIAATTTTTFATPAIRATSAAGSRDKGELLARLIAGVTLTVCWREIAAMTTYPNVHSPILPPALAQTDVI